MIIQQLTIYTGRLKEQIEFYQHLLGLSLMAKTETSAEFKIGHTILMLLENSSATPYHFAINIPANKDEEALKWLKQRVKILADNGHDLIDFKSWNAKAMYFYDSDKNIVELIARKNLKTEMNEPFNQTHFLGISEIGLSVQNIEETYLAIKAIKELSIYDGNFDKFCAVGDEQGLFIIIDQNKKGWFPTNDFANTSNFKISGDINLEFQNGQIKRY
ncbi:VOC family protein [Solitalea koreensis]|uniref:Catechol-2,3-dioxygenase n=1 Tax=Solitalea koreensis TaxID=543615 RepID=A0A521DWS4_9SPHI|nr:VOC family protein [Solitalea koreensis]SMO76095.1 Catechol-2,3-dioxygenase [Solitalea koreensis]